MRKIIEYFTNPYKTEEAFWNSILTGVKPGVPLYKMRKAFTVLKGDIRCKLCNIPFDGKWSWMFTTLWSKQSNLSPHFCLRCEDMAKDHMGGANINMTMLFIDVIGSTKLGGQMPPKEFRELLNTFYKVSTDKITENGGWLDKFVGDEAIGLFIPGFAGEDHAYWALKATYEILEATGHYSENGPWIPLGAGINTGVVFMGVVGGAKVKDITPLGDAVNMAARLSEAAGTGELYIGKNTMEMMDISNENHKQLLDKIELARKNIIVKGKSEPQEVYYSAYKLSL